MKTTRLMLGAVPLFLVLSAAGVSALSIGDTMPGGAVKLVNVDGRYVPLAKVVGEKGTLVIFSCNHCPWVKAWEGRLVAIGNDYNARGVGVIAVNSNDPKAYPGDGLPQMQERARAMNYLFPYVADTTSELGRIFGATHTPEAFLFDASGRLVYHGAIDDNARNPEGVTRHYLRDALDSVLGGQRPEVQETKALGCTIVLRKK